MPAGTVGLFGFQKLSGQPYGNGVAERAASAAVCAPDGKLLVGAGETAYRRHVEPTGRGCADRDGGVVFNDSLGLYHVLSAVWGLVLSFPTGYPTDGGAGLHHAGGLAVQQKLCAEDAPVVARDSQHGQPDTESFAGELAASGTDSYVGIYGPGGPQTEHGAGGTVGQGETAYRFSVFPAPWCRSGL